MTINTGLLEQVYVKEETSFAASAAAGGESLSATDAILHEGFTLTGKNNRRPSPQRTGTPDVKKTLAGRPSAAFNMDANIWEPSGTIGTPSNLGKFLKWGMGTQHAISGGLSTTVEASPSPTATGFTLASATGAQVGDLMIVETSAGWEATVIKTLATAAVTCHELTAAPAEGAAVLIGVTYRLASSLAGLSFSAYKYHAEGFKQATFGNQVEQLVVNFDGTQPATIAAQGPGARYEDSTTPDDDDNTPPQNKPSAHTTAGTPSSGMIGGFFVDDAEILVTGVQFTIQNNLELRNKDLGTRYATALAGRTNPRVLTARISLFLDDTTIFQAANRSRVTTQTAVLRLVVGDTAGSILAAVAPKVEFEVPDVGNEIGPKEITIEAMCLATAGNDGLYLAEV